MSKQTTKHEFCDYSVSYLYLLGLPCLSFDVIVDDFGCNRSDFPHSMYLVAGSQAEKAKDNCVIVMKVCFE